MQTCSVLQAQHPLAVIAAMAGHLLFLSIDSRQARISAARPRHCCLGCWRSLSLSSWTRRLDSSPSLPSDSEGGRAASARRLAIARRQPLWRTRLDGVEQQYRAQATQRDLF